MPSDRLEFSDAEVDDPAVTQSKSTKSRPVLKRKTLATHAGKMAPEKAERSDRDRHESPEENPSAGTDTQTEQLTPRIFSHQSWIIGVAVLNAVVPCFMCWYVNSKLDQLNIPDKVLAPLSGQYVSYTEFEKTKNAIEDLKKTLDQVSGWKPCKQDWDNLVQKMGNLEGLEISVRDLKNQTDEIMHELVRTTATVSDYNTIKEKVTEIQKAEETLRGDIQREKDDFEKFKKKYSENNEEIQKSLQNLAAEFNNRWTEIIEKNEKIFTAIKDDLGKKYDELDPVVKEVRGKVFDVLIPNAFNKEYVLAAFILLILVVLIFFCLQKRKIPPQQEQRISQRTNNMAENPILKQIVQKGPPENAMCVVSFNEHTQTHHKDLVEQALQGLPPKLREMCPQSYHTIRQHDQILQLPAVKLFWLFVDFSERNVIIEEPFVGQGDLKRTTVQAIEKLTGDYMIIYVKDPGSKRLEDNSRYNRNMTIVQTGPVLKELNQRGRFFSVYDKLSDFQRSSIQAIITDTFVA